MMISLWVIVQQQQKQAATTGSAQAATANLVASHTLGMAYQHAGMAKGLMQGTPQQQGTQRSVPPDRAAQQNSRNAQQNRGHDALPS